jgi:lysyl-tRNA synthetase class 1
MQDSGPGDFWTDQIARRIISREKFHFTDDQVPEFKKFVVKTSASLSGVLHIGRLSDTIRGEAVFRSLRDAGVKSDIIWVAEDMDPLRKVPEGVPKSYEEYIGMPVTDIPDPDGCHRSYGDHHVAEYFKVIDRFVSTEMEKFSMREEYRKGSFRSQIERILDNVIEIINIQNKYRDSKLSASWSPWAPICDSCGKIITPRVTGLEDGKVSYVCRDYEFEKYTAIGCGYEGENDPLKGNGKLLWKSEWAAQWPRWGVVSEGAGKEYEAKGSAFWINAEICEKILKYPAPVPIFYEHLMINGKKMSASEGNVIYPKDWLDVASPELLRMLFLKDPMRARDFRWDMIPGMYDELDSLERSYFHPDAGASEKERNNARRLFEQSQMAGIPDRLIERPRFASLVEILRMAPESGRKNFVIRKVAEVYGIKSMDWVDERLEKAEKWYNLHAQNQEKYSGPVNVPVLRELIDLIQENDEPDTMQNAVFDLAKRSGMKLPDFFRMVYRILLGSDSGPKLGPYIMQIGKEEVIRKLRSVI